MTDSESGEDISTPVPVRLGKKGEPLAPCDRPSFSANPVNKKYNSRYRNSENQNKLGGRLLDLGRATGLVAMTLYGFDVSLENAHSSDRMRIFVSAAWYALTDEELQEILGIPNLRLTFMSKASLKLEFCCTNSRLPRRSVLFLI